MSKNTEIIAKIKEMLDELDSSSLDDDNIIFSQNFDALEIPNIITSIIDFLQPLLFPYEASIYWYLFRNSVLSTGQQYCRASTRGLMSGVIQSSSGQSGDLSYAAVQKALAGLEEKEAISKAGDTSRDGTLYKINLPEEIEICQELIGKNDGDISEDKIDEKKELDYYNIAENRKKVFERDNYKCHYCEKQLTRFTATLDHIQPVSKGGDNSFDNLITACLHCNSRRGNRPVMEMYSDE